MTPAAFAKLCLRLLAAYLLVFVVPWSLPMTIMGIQTALSNGGDSANVTYQWLQGVMVLITTAIALGLWFGADRVLRYVLPAGADTKVTEPYERIQSVAMLFIGGVLALHAAQYGLEFIQSGDALNALAAGFDAAVAFMLIIGWRPVLGALVAAIRGLMRLRAKL